MLNALLGWNLLLTAALAIGLAGLCRLPSLARRPALATLALAAAARQARDAAADCRAASAGRCRAAMHPAAMATPSAKLSRASRARPVPAPMTSLPSRKCLPPRAGRHIGRRQLPENSTVAPRRCCWAGCWRSRCSAPACC